MTTVIEFQNRQDNNIQYKIQKRFLNIQVLNYL